MTFLKGKSLNVKLIIKLFTSYLVPTVIAFLVKLWRAYSYSYVENMIFIGARIQNHFYLLRTESSLPLPAEETPQKANAEPSLPIVGTEKTARKPKTPTDRKFTLLWPKPKVRI